MTKPKLLFVFDHKYEDRWLDGLWAALNILEQDFEITKLNLQTSSEYPFPDFVLGWGAFGSSVDKYIQDGFNNIPKKGLCIAGNSLPPTGANNYDVLFYETDWIRRNYLQFVDDSKTKLVKAFGINSDIYSPIGMMTPIVWDYIGVGAFAEWKRWDKMTEKQGNRLVIGEYQLNNEPESSRIALNLLRNGVMVSNMVNPYDLANLYHYSRTLYIPADINGGGERAVLEARSCGLTVEIEPDNAKLQELVDIKLVPDHNIYASQLKKGILSVL